MDEQKNEHLEYILSEVITGKPHEFVVGKSVTMNVYPVTLAKMFILKPFLRELEINDRLLKRNPNAEALRLVTTKKELCCSILSIHTSPNSYAELFDMKKRAERRNILMGAEVSSLAALLMLVLGGDRTQWLADELGITEEKRRIERVIAIKEKSGGNSMVFGGKTLFGSFIGQLKAIGYSDDEILYERPYSFLRLMLEDKVTSIYLTDDEVKMLPADASEAMFDGNDPGSFEKLKSSLAGKGISFNE